MDTTTRSPEYYKSKQSAADKFVTLYGVPFMKVAPVPSLLSSKTLKGVVQRGDWLVVNLNTGDLTIYSKARQEADAAKALEPRKEVPVVKAVPCFLLVISSTESYDLGSYSVSGKICTLLSKGVNILGSSVKCMNYLKGRTVVYDNSLSLNTYLTKVETFVKQAYESQTNPAYFGYPTSL